MSRRRVVSSGLAIFAFGLIAGCDSPRNDRASGANTPVSEDAPTVAQRVDVNVPVPADRMAARRVVTLYRWQRTEPGNATSNNEPIEHGTPKLHLLVEVHRDPQNHGWIEVAAIAGTTTIPESVRMRATPPGASEWHVPSGYTEYQLEQFGGEIRPGEPIRVLLASAVDQRIDLPTLATPSTTRLPQQGTLPPTPRAAVGQYDAIVVLLIPMSNRRGGRYLVYALDMLAQPAGFSANGVMSRLPTRSEIERYVRWMRDRNGMNRDRNPPIPMQPIDRT